MKLDAIDRKLLEMLQLDCDTPVAELAAAVQLSTTPCWRRVQRMKDAGVITGHVALVDPKSVNVGVTVFVNVRTSHASAIVCIHEPTYDTSSPPKKRR
jgi:Lrp/AsnC family transcriptional regulator